MRTCEAIYGPEQADNIEALVVLATGHGCPCRRAQPCPLVDNEGHSPLLEIIPAQSRRDDAGR